MEDDDGLIVTDAEGSVPEVAARLRLKVRFGLGLGRTVKGAAQP